MQYALCPKCSSTLQVSPQQINAKNGLVRCGHCNDIFDAIKHQLKTPKNVRVLELPQEERAIPSNSLESLTPEPAILEINKQLTQEQPGKNTQAESPVWEINNNKQRRNKPFGLLSFIAFIVLIFQLVSNYPDYFTQNVNLQPAFEKINQAFNLNIPRYKNTDEIRVLDRQLTPHLTHSDTLQLKLTIKNMAPVNQEYPNIHLTLSTLMGKNSASVLFKKTDYLNSVDIYDPFKPYSTKQITLNFNKPKFPIDGFEISFSF